MSGKGSSRIFMATPGEVMSALEKDTEKSRRHFVEEHSDVLVNEVTQVEPILKKLLEEDLLSKDEYKKICMKGSSQAKMSQLYLYAMFWDEEDKDEFYDILKRHHPTLIRDLESGKYKAPDGIELSSYEASCSFSSHVKEMDCDLCGSYHDPSDVLVVPQTQDNVYRLDLKSAGLFRCSVTGIKFQVTGPVTIEYEPDSWYNYSEFLKPGESGVLGPLFSIKTPQGPSRVSAMYLPHYLCLKELGGDVSWIRCAHFKDGNLSVEMPTRVLPFHIVLENPSFSALGAFCHRFLPSLVTQHIPLHGKVLLYFKVAAGIEYKIHLYLAPAFAPVTKEFVQEKERRGFQKIDKPHRTKTIYTRKKYIVNGPEHAHIEPLDLDVLCTAPLDSYTEISIIAEPRVELLNVTVLEQDRNDRIWGCRISRGDIEELSPRTLIAIDNPASFLQQRRGDLIQRVDQVDPILDSLLGEGLLTLEGYDIIRSQPTSQGKMRSLFDASRGWGDQGKEVLLRALRRHNAPLIQDLMGQ